MKASKLLSKKQRQQEYGFYIYLHLREKGILFEKFLTLTIRYENTKQKETD